MKPEHVGFIAVAALFFLTIPFYYGSSIETLNVDVNGGIDTNQVKVSGNDTTPGYLEDKLSAGTNITLTTLNEGGNEQVQISASGSATDTNCSVSGSCPSIVYQNTDANLVNVFFTGTISGGDFNYSLLDANDSQSCPAGQALQSVGNTTSCISVTGGGGSGRTYTSGTPSTIQVDNDANTISQNFDGNFQFYLSQALPLDYDVNVTNKPYVPSEADIDANALAVINSLDLNNSLDYAKTDTDTNCSFNNDCVLTGTIDTNKAADINNTLLVSTDSATAFKVTGTLADTFIVNTNVLRIQAVNLRPFTDNLYEIGASTLRWANYYGVNFDINGIANIATLVGNKVNTYDLNVSHDANVTNNLYVDGNLGNDSRFPNSVYAGTYIANGTIASLLVQAQAFAFCVEATFPNCSGLYFQAVAPRGYYFTIAGSDNEDLRHILFAGNGGQDGAFWHQPRTVIDASNVPAGTMQVRQRTGDGNVLEINNGTQASPVFDRVGSYQDTIKIDQNINFEKNDLTSATIRQDDQNRLTITVNDINQSIRFIGRTDDAVFRTMFDVNSGGEVHAPNLRLDTGGPFPVLGWANGEIIRGASSARYKDNITDLNIIITLEVLQSLRPRTWTDRQTGERGFGYIAEEVYPILPEIVYLDSLGRPDGIDYVMLSNMALAALQVEHRERLLIEADLNATRQQLNRFVMEVCTLPAASTLPSCQPQP